MVSTIYNLLANKQTMGFFDVFDDIPVIGDVTHFAENQFNGAFNLLNNLEKGAGNLAEGLGNMFNSPWFLYIMLILGGFIVYKTI